MAGRKNKRGITHIACNEAQGNVPAIQKSQAATGAGFAAQVAKDSRGITESIRPGVWQPGAVKR